MGAVEGFKGSGLFAKVSLVLLIIAALFVWIAYTCTGWGIAKSGPREGTHYGLWRICSDDPYIPGCAPTDGWANDWFAAVQALVTFGFFGINVALFLLILYMFVSSCKKSGELALATAIICFATGVLYLIGVIVFAAEFKDDYIDPGDIIPGWGDYELGYSFALSVVALVLEIVAGVFIILDSKKGGTTPSG